MGYESKVNLAVAFPDAEIADEVWSAYANDPLYVEYVKERPLYWERLTHSKGYVCFNYSSMNESPDDPWVKWYEDFPDDTTAAYQALYGYAETMDAPAICRIMRIGGATEDCEDQFWQTKRVEEEFSEFEDALAGGYYLLGGYIHRTFEFDGIGSEDWRAE